MKTCSGLDVETVVKHNTVRQSHMRSIWVCIWSLPENTGYMPTHDPGLAETGVACSVGSPLRCLLVLFLSEGKIFLKYEDLYQDTKRD